MKGKVDSDIWTVLFEVEREVLAGHGSIRPELGKLTRAELVQVAADAVTIVGLLDRQS